MSTASCGVFPLRAAYKPWPIQLALMLLGSLILAICSWIEIPMVPVPITMQSFGIVLIGALGGWRLGLGACLAYLAQGAMGMPVLAGGAAGIHHFIGPTAGYLAAFPIAAALVGWLAEKGCTNGVLRSFGVMFIGHAIILALGTLFLATKIGFDKAITFGLTPFLLGSVLKSALAAAMVAAAHRWKAEP
jgi:biotin transport system substrate-specific component